MEIPPQILFHKIHMQASVFDEFNPISYLFSLLNIKSKSHSQSQKSPFSLLPISSLSSLKSQISSLKSQPCTDWHTVHNPNPGCCRHHLITTLTASLTVHHGLRLLMLTDQLLSLKTLRYIFFLFHLSFSLFGKYYFFPFKFMYIALIFSFLFFFFGCFNLLIHKNEGKHMQMKESRNQTLGRMKKSTIRIDGEPLPI